MRTRTSAILWCFFLGAFGAHKFYLGQSGWGIVYLLFFWTGIPSIAAFIEFIMLLLMADNEFNRRFNGGANQAIAIAMLDSMPIAIKSSAVMELTRFHE